MMYNRSAPDMPMSPPTMYGGASGYPPAGYPQGPYPGGHPQRPMQPHHPMQHPMIDGYGDRMGYGPPGMPPGGPAGGMPNPAMQQRLRYAAMMGQERWPPPHQYMQPTQHPQGMSGPVNRFQPPAGPPEWQYPGAGDQFPGYPSGAMPPRPPMPPMSSDDRSSLPASPYMGMNAYSPGNQAYRAPHPTRGSNPSLASHMAGFDQQGGQNMRGANMAHMAMYLQQQQQQQQQQQANQAQGTANNSNAGMEDMRNNNSMSMPGQRMQAHLNKQDSATASPMSSEHLLPFQNSQWTQNTLGLGPPVMPTDLGSSPRMKDLADKQRQGFDKKVDNLEATIRTDFIQEEDVDIVKSLLSVDNEGATNSQDTNAVGEFGSQGEDAIPDPSSLTASPFVNSGESLESPFSEQGSEQALSPVTEKNKVLDGKSGTSNLQPHLLKQYALSQDPGRKEFLDNLVAYFAKEGKIITKPPVLSGQLLDLYKLYTSVQRYKGFVNVCASHLWKKVIEDLDVTNPKGLAAHNLRRQYIKYLLPYECALRNENFDDVLALAQRKWHSNSTNDDTTDREKEDLDDIGSLAKTAVSENDDSVPTSVPKSNSSVPQSGTTNVPRNLEQQNLNFSPLAKPNEANDLPHLPNDTSSVNSPFPAHLQQQQQQQQRDPLDSLSASPLNRNNLFNCSSPMSMPPHRSGTPSSQGINTGGMNNDWNRRPPGEMWNHPYPPDPAYRNMAGQPSKGYYGDPYRPSPPRHPVYGGMPGMGGNHPVEFAEYQRHGIRPPIPYQHNQQHHVQQMSSDPYRPYRLNRQGMMDFQSHGSGPGMMVPGSPMMPEWAWKQQQQQQQQQHHSRMGSSPYGPHYGAHISPQQHHQHQRVQNSLIVQQHHQQQQQQAYAARLEQQQHQQQWQDHNIKLTKAPYPTTAVQPSPIKSQIVAGAPQQQHHHHHHPPPSTESKSSSVAAALEKKVPPEWVNTVEGTKPVFAKKRKLMSNDCGSVEPWRLMMSLRSGVLSETTWALDTLNIMLHDDRTVIYFSLKHHVNLVNILTDHLKQCLLDVFSINFGSLLVYNTKHEGADLSTGNKKSTADILDTSLTDFDLLKDEESSKQKLENTETKPCPVPVVAVYSKSCAGISDTTIYVQTHIASQGHNCIEESAVDSSVQDSCREDAHVLRIDETPTSELLKREGVLSTIADVKVEGDEQHECKVEVSEDGDKTECKVEVAEVKQEDTAMDCDGDPSNKNDSVVRNTEVLCTNGGCVTVREENEIYSNEELPLCLIKPPQESLQARCLCVSNILRSLSFIPGNDIEMCRCHGLLRVLGRLLLLHHSHTIRKSKSRPVCTSSCTGKEVPEVTALTPPQPWWQDCLDQLQENSFVILANISGQLDLSKCPECIAYPILDGLIHWCVCTSARAVDPLPSSAMVFNLSPQRLVLEALAKMSIVENNIDLILATPPFNRLDKLYSHLVQILANKHQPVVRQFALVLLSNLAQGDETASHQIGQQESVLSLLIESIEDAEHAILSNRTKHSLAISSGEDPNVLSVAMLRRAAIMLHCLAKVPRNRPNFVMYQDRLLYLSCSEYLEQSVASIMMDVMYELGKVG
ncbi:AT-rich interactive domain-containing protein 1B-like isoform X2 [Dysidea avara]